MIENILEYELKDWEQIIFDDINQFDITSEILLNSDTDWVYELSEKIEFNTLELIKKTYNLDINWINNIWWPKLSYLINKFNSVDLLKFIKYSKKTYIENFGEEYWMKAYKNFLESYIIGNNIWYNKIIFNHSDFTNFLESELREIFKYYPKRWDKVWFVIDKLYIWWTKWNMDIFDNEWEINRYKYWMNLWEKWKSIIIK